MDEDIDDQQPLESDPIRQLRPSRSVFISHASTNRVEAGCVRDLLSASDVFVRLDISEVCPGLSFVKFMESALAESDYCLLLWSRAAGESKWVAVEWEAALHRTVSDASSFLIVCRLENEEVPVLLRPRLFVDLYPEIEPGVDRVLALLRKDIIVGDRTERAVAKPRAALAEDSSGARIYVTSRLFGKTFPLQVRLDTPVVAVVEMIVSGLGLPRKIHSDHEMGIRFDYGFAVDDRALAGNATLQEQGIAENSVLWLETSVGPFAGIEPVRRTDGRATYRSEPAIDAPDPANSIWLRAREALQSQIRVVGLE